MIAHLMVYVLVQITALVIVDGIIQIAAPLTVTLQKTAPIQKVHVLVQTIAVAIYNGLEMIVQVLFAIQLEL
jgi:hypothetical protein